MVGLEYILFIKELSGTDLANELGVSPQLVNHWIKGRREIPSEAVEFLSLKWGIQREYILKPLTPKDRIEIEVMMGGEHSNADLTALIQERDNLMKNYAKLLDKYHESEQKRSVLKQQLIDYIQTL